MTTAVITPRVAATELLLRRQARRDPVAYAQAIEVPGRPMTSDPDEARFLPAELPMADHHALFMRELDACALTPHGRLIIMAPPGSAKSTYTSAVFPTRYLGAHPGKRVIIASHSERLAAKHSKRARQIVRSRRYRSIYGTELAQDSRAANMWTLTNGGECASFGINSGATGSRADLLIIDDPTRGREDADSELVRNTTWDAYQDDLLTRLTPGASVVLMATRWHEDDLIGRVLPKKWSGESGSILGRDGKMWRVICLQAECTRTDDPLGRAIGDMLWPEWFDDEHWETYRHNPRTWSSLYQQVPSPEDGTYFTRERLPSWDRLPANMAVYMSTDYAVTERSENNVDPDYTVIRVWGIDENDVIHRIDGWRGQTTPEVWYREQCRLIKQWRPLACFGESGVIRNSTEGSLIRHMRAHGVSCRLEWLPSIKNKAARARAFQDRVFAGLVKFEPLADLSEFLTFPDAGRHDDEVDAASLMGRALEMAHPAIVQSASKPRTSRDYGMGSDDEEVDSWRTA